MPSRPLPTPHSRAPNCATSPRATSDRSADASAASARVRPVATPGSLSRRTGRKLASYGDAGHYLAPLFDVDTHVHGRLTHTHAPGVADLAERTGFDFGPQGSRDRHELGVNAAAYIQEQTERALCALAEQTITTTGLGNLCLAGGVALNCVAADKIRRLDTVTVYFAPPTASDRGQALGSPGTDSPATCPNVP
ncbi:carbamoyltransferase N-terminal domain-containing protein [Streptomyces sp. NPDC006290]|uniref:carbamoyltransferase N-terminal domain-containing protein n=1 Tax=Streptomyces sp. NPDC006290 TaxID=3156745 RepID=UPI0033B75168